LFPPAENITLSPSDWQKYELPIQLPANGTWLLHSGEALPARQVPTRMQPHSARLRHWLATAAATEAGAAKAWLDSAAAAAALPMPHLVWRLGPPATLPWAMQRAHGVHTRCVL